MNAPTNVRRPRSSAPGDPIDGSRPALRHFATVTVVFFVLCCVPYVHSSMADYRFLGRIDAMPLWRALTLTAPTSMENTVPTVAALAGDTRGLDGDVEALLARDPALLGANKPSSKVAIAEKLAPPKAGHSKGDKHPKKPAPAQVEPPGKAAKDPALGHALTKKAVERPVALSITAETLGDQKTWIDDPEHLLDGFYKALVQLAYGERDKVRVRHYGDSHLANDGITHAIRVMLQRRFGDGGHGFTLLSSRTKWYKHKGIVRTPDESWKARNFLGGSLGDGAYGYGGVAALGQAGSKFSAATTRKGAGSSASHIELWFRGVAMGRIRVYIDKERHIQKVGKGTGDRWLQWDVPDGKHTFKLQVESGWMRAFGVVFERDKGLVYDSLGVVGARASRWRNAGAAHLKGQFERRPTDLMVFSYGGNSRKDRISEDKYVSRYKATITRLRIARSTEPCLVMSPTAHGMRSHGAVVSDEATERLVKWQRRVAEESGCAFFDANAWMGEVGDMNLWVKKGLVWHDFAHLTPRGQSYLGQALYRAYLQGLDGYLKREGDGLSGGTDTAKTAGAHKTKGK